MFRAKGKVISGYGRGSKQLGFPTANLEINLPNEKDGVYYGYVIKNGLREKCVMSIGNNPQFCNQHRTYEVYIMKEYLKDFYGEEIEIDIRGYIRPMEIFNSIDELIETIKKDVEYVNSILS